MIVCSEKHLIPVSVNTITLKKDDYYFYVHRDVYDSAVALSDRYTFETLLEKVEPEKNRDIMNYYKDKFPKPLDILVPFLSLLNFNISDELAEDQHNVEIITGILHVITNGCDVRRFIQIPKEVRRAVTYSIGITEEYEMSWERFFDEAIDYDDLMNFLRTGKNEIPKINYHYEPAPPIEVDSKEIIEEKSEDEIRYEKMMEDADDILGDDDELKKILEEAKNSSNTEKAKEEGKSDSINSNSTNELDVDERKARIKNLLGDDD